MVEHFFPSHQMFWIQGSNFWKKSSRIQLESLMDNLISSKPNGVHKDSRVRVNFCWSAKGRFKLVPAWRITLIQSAMLLELSTWILRDQGYSVQAIQAIGQAKNRCSSNSGARWQRVQDNSSSWGNSDQHVLVLPGKIFQAVFRIKSLRWFCRDIAQSFFQSSTWSVAYKVISKILANRLKQFLPSLISPMQSAFVQGRMIQENSILTHEVFHMLRNKWKGKQYMAIRADIEKGNDCLEWALIVRALECFGFPAQFINWINRCMSSISYSILLNGSPFGFFKPSRGLQQGDPISLLLFIIGSKVFSSLLFWEEFLGKLHGICIGRVFRLSHIFSMLMSSLFFARLIFGKLKLFLHAYSAMVAGLGNILMCENPLLPSVKISAPALAKKSVIFYFSRVRIMWKNIWGFRSLSPKISAPNSKLFVKEWNIVWRVGKCVHFLKQGVWCLLNWLPLPFRCILWPNSCCLKLFLIDLMAWGSVFYGGIGMMVNGICFSNPGIRSASLKRVVALKSNVRGISIVPSSLN